LTGPDKNKTIGSPDDFDLTEFLETLGSKPRMTILKFLKSNPTDVQPISKCLHREHIQSSRINTKNHVDKLLKLGLIRKRAGERNSRAVMQYVFVPGRVEAAIRILNEVLGMNLDFELREKAQKAKEKLAEILEEYATLRVLGGLDDGLVFPLRKNEIKLGRIDYANKNNYDFENDVVLSNSYEAVTRVSKPHSKLVCEDGKWYIEHCEGLNGTFILKKDLLHNDKKPVVNRKELTDDDTIILATGLKSVSLVFRYPRIKNKK
jgi:DNA-binding MarR family transcriptional regulator